MNDAWVILVIPAPAGLVITLSARFIRRKWGELQERMSQFTLGHVFGLVGG